MGLVLSQQSSLLLVGAVVSIVYTLHRPASSEPRRLCSFVPPSRRSMWLSGKNHLTDRKSTMNRFQIWWQRFRIESWFSQLDSKSREERHTAASVLGDLKDARALEPLVERLCDDAWNVRRVAAGALGQIGDARAVNPLVERLSDDQWSVRRAAAGALGEIGNARAVKPLTECLADYYGDVRRSAGQALEKIDTDWESSPEARAAMTVLVERLSDDAWNVRRAAGQALEKIDADWQSSMETRVAVPMLIERLADDDREVQEAAAHVLGQIGDTRALKPLIERLADTGLCGCVEHAVRQALEKINPDWQTSSEAREVTSKDAPHSEEEPQQSLVQSEERIIAQKRLVSLLASMNTRREDHRELCERLLDAPTSRLGRKPRRFAADSRTQCTFGKADVFQLDQAESPDLISAVSRILDGAASQDDHLLVVAVAHQVSGVQITPEGLELEVFNYDNQPGCLICVWEDKPLKSEAHLVCKNCNQVFDFTAGACMVTDEAVEQAFLSAGGSVFKHHSRTEHPDPDLVFTEMEAPEHRGIPPYVLQSLRAGKYRRWRCKECEHVQGYPGSFFLVEKTDQSVADSEPVPAKPNRKADEELFRAIDAGDFPACEHALDRGANPNADPINGLRPLPRSIGEGHVAIVKLLLARGADVEDGGEGDWTPLMSAAMYGDCKIIKALIEHGARVEGHEDHTPLSLAAQNNHLEASVLLLEHGANPNHVHPQFRTSPLFSVMDEGNRELALVLLDFGANPNVKNLGGANAFMYAVNNGDTELVEKMIISGADVNVRYSGGGTPLDSASILGYTQIVELLINAGGISEETSGIPVAISNETESTLTSAARKGDIGEVESLLRDGADPNLDGGQGWTALMEAAEHGHTDVARLLLDAKADPNLSNNIGRTALMIAASQGHAKIARLLIDHGADTEIRMSVQNTTALTAAAREGHPEIVKLLLKAGADPDAEVSIYGSKLTALDFAKPFDTKGHRECVRLLTDEP